MNHTVYLVDDDASVIAALTNLLKSEDYRVAPFTSPQSFLAEPLSTDPCCLIVDINMPGADGFDVTRALSERGYSIPNHLSYRLWHHSDHGKGDEGRCL